MSDNYDARINSPERESFGDFFALSRILGTTLKDTEYQLGERAITSLSYSEYGLEVYNEITRMLPETDPRLVHLAMACEFCWKDLFFDHASIDMSDIMSDIATGIRTNKLVLPYVFGGLLYRKANQSFTDMKEVLTPTETTSLLSDTPQGVFQMRAFVTGPLGVLRSLQKRDYRPRRSAPLWHCSDPSCTAIHIGRFAQTPGPLKLVQEQLRKHLRTGGEPMPDRELGYYDIDEDPDYYDDLHTGDLIPLLGDAFSLSEIRALLKDMLDRPSGLRARLSKMKLGIKMGSSQQTADNLDAGGCLQLILLDDDHTIIESLERLIDRGTIKIPFSEVRTAQRYQPRAGWYAIRCEASRYGVRFATRTTGVPLARLKRVIREIYEPSGNIGELAWKLRYIPGETVPQRLDHYVHQTDPEAVIFDHVFGSAGAPERAFRAMRYGYFPNAFSRDQEPHIAKKIIWKLGSGPIKGIPARGVF